MRFKSTQNIFKDFGEVFEQSWMDSNKVGMPPKTEWDYSRQLQIEDVDIWEVLAEQSGPTGIYAAWCPYAEFYMVVTKGQIDSTYFGEGSDKYAAKRLDELNIIYPKK